MNFFLNALLWFSVFLLGGMVQKGVANVWDVLGLSICAVGGLIMPTILKIGKQSLFNCQGFKSFTLKDWGKILLETVISVIALKFFVDIVNPSKKPYELKDLFIHIINIILIATQIHFWAVQKRTLQEKSN